MNCELCGSSNTKLLAHAVLAPWITEIFNDDEQCRTSQLLRCIDCEFQFFSHRYSDEEMNKLYSDYRGTRYYQIRHKHEPWFTRSVMHGWDPQINPQAVNSRRTYMFQCLKASGINLNEVSNVLDFGGDLGQFFPEESLGERYLIDPANVVIVEDGITRIQNIEFLENKCGLIMNCHTLEHIPNLRKTMLSIVPAMKKGGFLYIEVPMDGFQVSRLHVSELYRFYLSVLNKSRFLFTMIDFASGVYRTFRFRIPFWGIVKQSEHINYFSAKSLEGLLNIDGIKVLAISDPDLNFGQGRIKLGRISLVAVRS